MNTMSFKELKRLFLEKYENGAIFKDSQVQGRIYVAYTKGGKCYGYRYSNHLELAKRLNLIDYNIEYDRTIDMLEKQIARQKELIKQVENDEIRFYLGSKKNFLKQLNETLDNLTKMYQTSIKLAHNN